MAYSVKEIFYTLQGEGGQAGMPAVFCRFAGCNLWSGREQDRASAVCRFCDTDFVGTDGTLGGKFASAQELAARIAAQWPAGDGAHRLVVLTGGEPLLQVDAPLVDALHAQGFRVAVERRQPQPPAAARPQSDVKGPGFVDLTQRPDGHYYAVGYVNGVPAVFMVDTGASLTTLSQEIAYKSGIDSCATRTFNTANGPAQGCVAKVSKIQIGGFVLRDFEVAVMPNLPTDALLGMNVMRMLRLEQQNGVMRLSVR
jgi:clan AA aspartic protease (TIGR02281 family)